MSDGNDQTQSPWLVAFEVSLAPGWEAGADHSSKPSSAQPVSQWSVATARAENGAQRLGIFISLDTAALLSKREWQLALEQEVALARDRARQLLHDIRKASKETSGPR